MTPTRYLGPVLVAALMLGVPGTAVAEPDAAAPTTQYSPATQEEPPPEVPTLGAEAPETPAPAPDGVSAVVRAA